MNGNETVTNGPAAPTRGRRMGGRSKWVLGTLILVTALGLAVGIPLYLHYRHTHVSTDDAFVDGHIYYVTPRIPGKIAELLVEDNQPVEAGQVLVKLDPRDLEADLHVAQANLESVRNQVAAQIESAAALRAQASGLRAQARYAARQKQRATMLSRAQALPEAQYDEASMRWRSVSDQQIAAERQRKVILARLGPRAPEGELADIELAQAQLTKAQLQLEHATIRSPVRGLVTRRQVEVGQTVAPAQPLFAVVPLDHVFVTANYKETDLTDVRPGQRVRIAVDTYPDLHLEGRVDSIMSGTGAAFSLIPPENATGNYVKVVQRIPVKITLVQHDGGPLLRIGMSVVPTILVEDP